MRASSSARRVCRRHAARLAGAALSALTASCAYALQTVEASDGVSVEAIVSIREPTRIRIDGTPITDVFGNIHSSRCGAPTALLSSTPGLAANAPPASGTNAAGEVVVECDQDKGEIYVRPIGDATKPINLFVSSANATYTLLLRRADVPADTIVIRDKAPRLLRPAGAQPSPGPASSYIRAMKALLVAMASDRVPPDVRVEEVRQPVQLWAEARFSLVRRYDGRGLLGEKYLLQNIGGEAMVLAEQEFDREGAGVAGVAIENHNLRPSETTSVYVIRREVAR